MITHTLRSASHTAEQALVLLNRSQATVADYRDTFGHICRIAERFPTTDPIEYLQQYSAARSAYLSSIYATKSNQLRHERAVKLLMLALHGADAKTIAQQFCHPSRDGEEQLLLPPYVADSLQNFKTYLKDQHLSSETIKSYEIKVRSFLKHLTKIESIASFDELDTKDIMEGLSRYAKTRSRWVKKAIPATKKYFDWLNNNGYIQTNFAYLFRVQLPKWEPEVKFFTEGQVKLLLDSLDMSNPDDVMLHAVISLVNYIGLRRADIANLKVNNIDWKNRVITLIQSKTKKTISGPISENLAISLSRYLLYVRPIQAQEFVFCQLTPPFTPLGPRNLGFRFQALRERVFGKNELKNYGLHAIRRGLGTRLFRSGVDITIIQEILGHRSEGSNWPYIQADIENLRDCCISIPPGGQNE